MTLVDHTAPRPGARSARVRLAEEGLVAAYLHELSTRRQPTRVRDRRVTAPQQERRRARLHAAAC